jgi:hypothetical protein
MSDPRSRLSRHRCGRRPGRPVHVHRGTPVRVKVSVSFELKYSTSQWAAAYQLLSPAAQHAVSEATWAKAQQGCPNQGAELADTIKSVTLAGNTAVVRAAPPRGAAGPDCGSHESQGLLRRVTAWSSELD